MSRSLLFAKYACSAWMEVAIWALKQSSGVRDQELVANGQNCFNYY
ncbi:MAG TPA: hypothetical protein PK695_12610 [Chitinophagaceae bacterium]|nr:hypothetical protein [Chitinophagaceae bacterium]